MAEVAVHAEDPDPLVAALMWGIGHSVSVVDNGQLVKTEEPHHMLYMVPHYRPVSYQWQVGFAAVAIEFLPACHHKEAFG